MHGHFLAKGPGSWDAQAVVDNGTVRGIQGGIGGRLAARWATIYAGVADADQFLSQPP